MCYLNSTLNFGILPALVFKLEVYYKVDRLLTCLTAQPKGTIAQWYSNKTSLILKAEYYLNFEYFVQILVRLLLAVCCYPKTKSSLDCIYISQNSEFDITRL